MRDSECGNYLYAQAWGQLRVFVNACVCRVDAQLNSLQKLTIGIL